MISFLAISGNWFRQATEPLGKFIPSAKYPYVFTDTFQLMQNRGKGDVKQ